MLLSHPCFVFFVFFDCPRCVVSISLRITGHFFLFFLFFPFRNYHFDQFLFRIFLLDDFVIRIGRWPTDRSTDKIKFTGNYNEFMLLSSSAWQFIWKTNACVFQCVCAWTHFTIANTQMIQAHVCQSLLIFFLHEDFSADQSGWWSFDDDDDDDDD